MHLSFRWFRLKLEKRVDIQEAVRRGRKVPACAPVDGNDARHVRAHGAAGSGGGVIQKAIVKLKRL